MAGTSTLTKANVASHNAHNTPQWKKKGPGSKAGSNASTTRSECIRRMSPETRKFVDELAEREFEAKERVMRFNALPCSKAKKCKCLFGQACKNSHAYKDPCSTEVNDGFCSDGTCQCAHAHDFKDVATWKAFAKKRLEEYAAARRAKAAQDTAAADKSDALAAKL